MRVIVFKLLALIIILKILVENDSLLTLFTKFFSGIYFACKSIFIIYLAIFTSLTFVSTIKPFVFNILILKPFTVFIFTVRAFL